MSSLTRNVKPVERVLRIAVGIALLAIAGPGRVWGFLGIFPLATGLIGRCPIYTLLGRVPRGGLHRRPRTP